MVGKVYEPEHYARELLSSLGLQRIQNLHEILHALNLKVVEKELTSIDGVLIQKSGKGIIAVNRNIKERGRKNFTICHEVGHYILPKHGSASCRADEIDSWKKSNSRFETEANRFASELLMPTKVIYPIVRDKKATVSLAKEIANGFNASLTAAALKCVEVTEESCAVVWSVNNHIVWRRPNGRLKDFIPVKRLDSDSLAFRLFEDESVREREGFVYSEAWFESDYLSAKDMVWEDSILLPAYNAVLTILTLES